MIPRLPQFSAQHPDIELQVFYADSRTRLPGSPYDVLITLGMGEPNLTSSQKLFSRISKPVCSPHYLAKVAPIEMPEHLIRANLLHDEDRDSWRDWFAKAGLDRFGALSGPVFQDFNLLATAAVAGHGVALCPVDVFRQELEQGDLVVVSPFSSKDEEGYYLITEQEPSLATRQFSDWFAKVIDGSHQEDADSVSARGESA